MPKNVNVDFYRVVLRDNAATTFDALLDRISEIPSQDDAWTPEIAGAPVRLQDGEVYVVH